MPLDVMPQSRPVDTAAKLQPSEKPLPGQAKTLDTPADKAEPSVMQSLGGDLLSDPQAVYDAAHGKFEREKKAYWDNVAAEKKAHHFVMTFPPEYTGPPKPKPDKPTPVAPNTIPTINEMLADAKHLNQFAFGDKNQPTFNLTDGSEAEFKQNYAREALRVGRAHGLQKDEVRDIVRSIYAFEDGGWGTHDTLSSMPQSLVAADKPGSTAIRDARRNFHLDGATASSALGYNQLLMLNTMEKISHQSKPISDRLEELAKAESDPARAAQLQDKARMVAALGPALTRELQAMVNDENRKPPDERKNYLNSDGTFSEQLLKDFGRSKDQTSVGLTRQDMARAVHALNLDADVGPIIQAQEFGNLLTYADKFNYQSLLQGKDQADQKILAAYDALPAGQKAKAVQEIMDLVKPQPDAATKNNLVQKLTNMHAGVDDNLSRNKLPKGEADLLRTGVLTLRSIGEKSGALSPPAQLLLSKIAHSYYGGLDATKLTPAALELANLAGPKNAEQMLHAENAHIPTPNFFSQAGYYANPVTNRRTAAELLLQIQRSMRGPNYDATLHQGQADFESAFARLP
ncbi:MAG: hypothetical protein JST01_08580 [Cyanobacteria bacterium SZAS TMP-1]|nr:hypothetical protein [Cyanobacteria bacterium SZAS TMP-1]